MANYDNDAVEAKLDELKGEVMEIRAELDQDALEDVKRLEDEDIVSDVKKDVEDIDDHLERAEICESFGDFLVNMYEAGLALSKLIGRLPSEGETRELRRTLRTMQREAESVEINARSYSEKVTARMLASVR